MSDDPRWLGPRREDLEDAVRILASEADTIGGHLRLCTSPEWREFIKLIESRAEEVDRELGRAESWGKTCKLQGQRKAYDWLLGFEDQQRVALEGVIAELQGYQQALEGTT